MDYKGLKKTKPVYLNRFLTQKKGITFDSLAVQKDVQRLKNLQLFYQVDYVTKDSLNGVFITYNLKEVVTLLPILYLGGIKNNFWFTAGLQDLNFRGKGIQLGGFYRYYDRHSAQVFIKNNYIKGSKWGYEVNIAQLASVEPLYFSQGTVFYTYDNTILEGIGSYEIIPHTRVKIGGAYLKEYYKRKENDTQQIEGAPTKHSTNKALFKISCITQKVNYNGVHLDGFSNDLFIETVRSKIAKENFVKMSNELKYYKQLGLGNFATRLRTGIATNTASPFAPFVLDSYLNIRGVGNKVNRGTAEIALNIEYRQLLFKNRWFYLQGIGFSDMGSWRGPGHSFKNMFTKEHSEFFSGLGFRLHFKEFYNSILRVDYGVSLKDNTMQGFVLGFGQYF